MAENMDESPEAMEGGDAVDPNAQAQDEERYPDDPDATFGGGSSAEYVPDPRAYADAPAPEGPSLDRAGSGTREIDELLQVLYEEGGSDLHIKVGTAPTFRVDGVLARLEGEAPMTEDEVDLALRTIIPSQTRYDEFLTKNEADFAYTIESIGRFHTVPGFTRPGARRIAGTWMPPSKRPCFHPR